MQDMDEKHLKPNKKDFKTIWGSLNEATLTLLMVDASSDCYNHLSRKKELPLFTLPKI